MYRLVAVLLLLSACAGGSGPDPVTPAGQGALSIQVMPNPIVARNVGGDNYEFPFTVLARETGGRPVEITRVTVEVRALGGFTVGTESWDAAKIRAAGYGTSVRAGGELRYQFSPRRSVPDERLFGGVTAEVRVEGVDDLGKATTARVDVTVTKS